MCRTDVVQRIRIRRYSDTKTVNQSEYEIRKISQQRLSDMEKRKSSAIYLQISRIRNMDSTYRQELKYRYFQPKKEQFHNLVYLFRTIRKRQLV